jgi:hypothetical protein
VQEIPISKVREKIEIREGETSSVLKHELRALEYKLIDGKERLVRAESALKTARANSRNSRSHSRAQDTVDKFREEYRGMKTSKRDLERKLRVLKSDAEIPPTEPGWMCGFRHFM